MGHENGVDYLVMEYLEGQTLADRLARGALPLDQAILKSKAHKEYAAPFF